MHLLRAQGGVVDDGAEAVDLGLDPADIVVLSHADTELALLARARQRLGDEAPDLRLVNLSRLRHHLSVDTFVERTIERSRLVVVRLLGGEASWSYGLERLATVCRSGKIALVVLPGDDRPDPALARLSTVEPAPVLRLWAYLVEGGVENARHFLLAARALLDGGAMPPEAVTVARAGIHRQSGMDAPRVTIVFYRALVLAEDLAAVDTLFEACEDCGLSPQAVFVSSLKDPASAAFVDDLFAGDPPQAVINLTGFAVSASGAPHEATPLDRTDAPVLQAVLASTSREQWLSSSHGLPPRDLAMSVVMPEIDGRIFTRAIAFKSARERSPATQSDIIAFSPDRERTAHVARQARAWIDLRLAPKGEHNIAIMLANYPNQDARLANGVGLDTPQSVVDLLCRLKAEGYDVAEPPANSAVLMDRLRSGPTNQRRTNGEIAIPLGDYRQWYQALPQSLREAVEARWGAPETDPACMDGAFHPALHRFGRAILGIQPARGYNIDPKATYHDPALVPPHNYIATYLWLRHGFSAHAVIHMGKHGNLEWLPGKALALGPGCWPDVLLGPLPHLYPFIVNDPGEGSQAKRRTAAVIIDHLTPPLTRAESYGPLKDLEALVDEYYDASGQDPRRLQWLKREILDLVNVHGLDRDIGIDTGEDDEDALTRLDAYLCDLKEMQIRDGLHVFGSSPQGRQESDLLAALARVPGTAAQGLTRALADDLGLGFDPLDCDMAAPWPGPRPAALDTVTDARWRSHGDTVERLEMLALDLIEERTGPSGPASAASLRYVLDVLRPQLRMCGTTESEALLRGLDGRFVAPGPSGAPTRGRPDVLPTGRNFYSIDTRCVPTPAAWHLGWASATLLLERYRQDHGRWPERIGLSAWGTANMRTGGDDIAQALALMGVRPCWDGVSRRMTGFEIMPLSVLGRPRVDVTLRVSGFFRDAFPEQMDLVDSAARAVMELDEPPKDNPLRARFVADRSRLEAQGHDPDDATDRASFRVFGSMPGAYGAGLQALIDERLWETAADFADAYLAWGSFAYGRGREGVKARGELESRLAALDAVIQNQDNREHDILDSDDYYQFQGGMTAAAHALGGQRPAVFLNDHSRPENPRIRTLEEEIGRVVRARVVNPKWIRGVMRHGYKGAFEMSATVDYLFAYAATTGAVSDHHFDLVHAAFLDDDEVRGFLQRSNPDALDAIARRLDEAIGRGLWKPRRNSVALSLRAIEEGTPP
ncbi:MAG: cobaltochelatase subunit CobN [Geminicoccaceae bacterium]|nr:cobaltochelatase subunit CobN [Geminicoccaceae bacterium]